MEKLIYLHFQYNFLYVKLYEILIKRYLGVPSGSDDNDRLPFVLCLLCGRQCVYTSYVIFSLILKQPSLLYFPFFVDEITEA